jgi:hypothetical protein
VEYRLAAVFPFVRFPSQFLIVRAGIKSLAGMGENYPTGGGLIKA